ncbi:SDR family NAD(P)-dependent oxidoreductase [Actinoplanes sp. NPDC051851]|uniref:SDR family NAD(P)-dependent oxidoreductase n=1 Tax=Actinoplanes sp. NPDC051851 TaxID=3154753 RepID=UPI00341C32B3
MIDFLRPLAGKNALIIGGGGEGIGRAISRAFAAAGAAVAVADLLPERAEAAAAELIENGARAVGLAGGPGPLAPRSPRFWSRAVAAPSSASARSPG